MKSFMRLMPEVSADQLKEAVEGLHGCEAILRGVEPVHETFDGETVWEGNVHIFDLTGHPEATVCYAWSMPMDGSENGSGKRRFYAVLELPPVASALDAVKAAILREQEPDVASEERVKHSDKEYWDARRLPGITADDAW